MPIPGIEVVPLLADWNLNITNTGQSGTKKYLDASAHPRDDIVAVELPNLSDWWDDTHPNCVCVGISVSYLKGEYCGKIYTLTYSSDQGSGVTDEAGSIEDLPITLSTGANYMTYDGASGGWKWASDATAVGEDFIVSKREVIMLMEINRYVYARDLREYSNAVLALVGRVNGVEFFGMFIGCVRFAGCEAVEMVDENNFGRKWRMTLRFECKKVGVNKGWQHVYRPETNDYDEPKVGAVGLYEVGDFDILFELGRRAGTAFPPIAAT